MCVVGEVALLRRRVVAGSVTELSVSSSHRRLDHSVSRHYDTVTRSSAAAAVRDAASLHCSSAAALGQSLITARSELRKVLFLSPSVCFFPVYETSREPLNGFASNSHGRRVWSLGRTSLKVKVKGQRVRSPGTKYVIFWPFRRPACGLCLVKHLWPLVFHSFYISVCSVWLLLLQLAQ